MTRKKLSPIEKRSRIEELKKIANEEFDEAETIRREGFRHALRCGEALIEIKSLVGHGNWIPWVTNKKNFMGSYETAVVYMSIAKNWSDPRIVEARKEVTIDSIKGFHEVLRGKPYLKPDAKGKQPTENIVYERYRKGIIAEFKREVNSLGRWKHWSKRYELFVLGEYFGYFWNKLHAELKRVTEKGRTKQRIDRSLRKAVRASKSNRKKR